MSWEILPQVESKLTLKQVEDPVKQAERDQEAPGGNS